MIVAGCGVDTGNALEIQLGEILYSSEAALSSTSGEIVLVGLDLVVHCLI